MDNEAKELCARLKPVLGRKIDALWYSYITEDAEGKQEILTTLNVLAAKALKANFEKAPILLSPPSKIAVAGPFQIGTVVYNNKLLYPACLDEKAMLSHIGVFGRTGTGKTNFCLALLGQLRQKNIPFLILDWKRNYRDLLAETDDLRVYTVGRSVAPFSFQPMIPPPGTSPTIWLKLLIDILAAAYYVGEGVKYLLMKATDAVYREAGVYTGQPKAWPTFRNVQAWLENYHPANARESQWMISTMRTLQCLCYGEMGRVVNQKQQTSLDDLLRHNVVLELDALTQTDKTFFSEAFLLWVHHFRMQESGRETLKHVIVVEEAHHLLKASKTETESIMEITLREIRELGQGILLIDQTPSQIAPTALANTGTKVCLNLPHRTDITVASAALLLDAEQKDFLGMLPVGMAIVKLQDRHFLPFAIQIPWIRIKKGLIGDDALRRAMRRYSADSTPCSQGQAEYGTFEEIPAAGKGKLTDEAHSFIMDIREHPLSGVASRYERMNISGRKGNAVKENLLSNGSWTKRKSRPKPARPCSCACQRKERRWRRAWALNAAGSWAGRQAWSTNTGRRKPLSSWLPRVLRLNWRRKLAADRPWTWKSALTARPLPWRSKPAARTRC